MPVPHFNIKITQRSKGNSAVAGAAYQAGEKLFSEYDQKTKNYTCKKEVVYTEIMLPPNAPPEYADRATLWNSVEEIEKQWNSQLARRFVAALPREVPMELLPQMVKEYCEEQFVSKGMCCDFAIHDPDPPGHNPHCHFMLTMRAIDENGKWMPKSRKVYDLDENGERIKLPSGRWKSHKEDTVDWNEQYHAEEWRHGWEIVQNKYLELAGSPERIDMRSYERQGLDIIPTVHMGTAVSALERKGIATNIGNLNRDIKAANRMMNAIRSTIKSLRDWIADILEATKEVIAENATMYDELELDKLGDRKTALFLIMSDTDSTFNFLISMIYTQLFNLLCDKADDVYGGKLPVHVRCLIDECANIGQIPQLEKLVATIRSREISACLVLQTRSQLKAIYKDNADTIVGNMDSQIFLGGSEPTTLKDLAEALGKETIDSYNNSDTRGNSPSYGTNYQKLGHELMSRDELAVLDGGKCILQLRGVRPFLSDKYDLTQHPNYKYTSDYDSKNALDIEKFLNRKEKIHPDDTFVMVDADLLPPA